MPPTEREREIFLKLQTIEDKVDLTHQLLTGNGTPERGLVVRVDRLEQTEVRRSRVVSVAITAAVGALFKSFWSSISGGSHS